MEQLKVPVNEEGWSYREIDPHDLQFDVILGSGAFGKVQLASKCVYYIIFLVSFFPCNHYVQVYKGFWRGAEVVRPCLLFEFLI